MQFDFCPRCGTALVPKPIGDEGLVPCCPQCDRPWFPLSYACVICVVMNERCNRVLLIRQPEVGSRFINVAGYVQPGETIEQTAAREVHEEVGLMTTGLQYVKSYYYSKRDQLMFGFAVQVAEGDLRLSCELCDAQWFSVKDALVALRESSIALQLLRDYLIMCGQETALSVDVPKMPHQIGFDG